MELNPECRPSELEGWKEAAQKSPDGPPACLRCGEKMEATSVPPPRDGDRPHIKVSCGCGFEALLDWGGKALWYPSD